MGGLRNFFEDFLASLDHAESADAIWTAALDAIGRVPVSGEVGGRTGGGDRAFHANARYASAG
jgi:hypothetical protein